MTTGALDLPDTSRLEDDDAKDELRKVLRAHRRAHHHHPAQGLSLIHISEPTRH